MPSQQMALDLIGVHELHARRALAATGAEHHDDLAKLGNFLFDEAIGRRDFHALGTPSKTRSWRRIAAPDQIDPEAIVERRAHLLCLERHTGLTSDGVDLL